MADEFFQDPNAQPTVIEPEKIKVGDDEFTQDELKRLVGLGKIGDESEKNYKTRIDKVWPNYQRVINEKRDMEAKIKEYETKLAQGVQQQQAQQPGQPLTQEQIKAEALKQARELGLVTRDELDAVSRQRANEMIQGDRLINDIGKTIEEMTADGLPSTTTEDVINHMQETGIKNPRKAYKDMFEKEWDDLQVRKLSELKTKGMPTISQSVAGGKVPPPVKITKDNLDQLVNEAFKGPY